MAISKTGISEQRFIDLVASIPGAVYQCLNQPDWPMVYLNDEIETLSGYPASDFIDQKKVFSDIIYPEDRDYVWNTIQNSLHAKKPYALEYRIVHKSGDIRWVFERGQGYFDGEIEWLTGTIFNITEKRQAENDLHIRAAQQKVVAFLGQRVIRGIDLETLFDAVTKTVADTLKVECCKILELMSDGQSLLLRAGVGWHEGLVGSACVSSDQDSQAGFTLVSDEPVIVDDLRTETRFHGPQLLDDHNIISGISVIIEGRDRPWGILGAHTTQHRLFSRDDVSFLQSLANILTGEIERCRYTSELRQSEERFRQLAENVPEVFWIGAPTWTDIYYISPAYEKVWKRPRPSLYDAPQSWLESVHPDDVATVTNFLATRDPQDPTPAIFPEYRIIWPDGTIRWISARGFPVVNDKGEVWRITGLAEDITERKQAEAERLELANQLRQSQKMEAVGQLAGGVAHDFNNLLTTITGFTELARDTLPDDSETHKLLKNVENAATQAAGVTRSLLTFSRRMPITKECCDLIATIRDSIRLLTRVLPASIDIKTTVPDTPILIDADKTQLQQVIMNLAINSRDAMPTGGTLTIAARQLSDADRTIELQVCDTGVGMPPEIQERVFEPFFTTKSRGQGTGLGLAIAHGIVLEHSGTISIQSELNVGTTITIHLPPSKERLLSPATHASQVTQKGHGELVLLAEDQAPVRRLINSALAKSNYEIIDVGDGNAFLDSFAQHSAEIRLLILDFDLPGRNGLDCLRTLRAEGHKTPAIIVTGSAMISAEDIAEDDALLIRKPFELNDLRKVVKAAIATDQES